MKRTILFTILLVLLSLPAIAADTWYRGQTVTIRWDPITTFEDGTQLLPEDVSALNYDIYAINDKTGAVIKIGNVSGIETPIAVPSKGWYRFGVVGRLGETDASPMSRTDNPAACLNGNTFGLRWLSPSAPAGLAKK